MMKIPKPKEGEYAPYAIMYISLLPDDGSVLMHMKNNYTVMNNFILSLPEVNSCIVMLRENGQ